MRPPVASLALLPLLAAPAAAGDDDRRWTSAESQVSLELGPGFRATEGSGPMLSIEASGIRGTLVRIDRANRTAWVGSGVFFDQVADGAKTLQGYRAIRNRERRLGRVPAMDLWFLRAGPGGTERVAMRMLFFRRYTIVLTLAEANPKGRSLRRDVRDVVESLEPYFPPETDS